MDGIDGDETDTAISVVVIDQPVCDNIRTQIYKESKLERAISV